MSSSDFTKDQWQSENEAVFVAQEDDGSRWVSEEDYQTAQATIAGLRAEVEEWKNRSTVFEIEGFRQTGGWIMSKQRAESAEASNATLRKELDACMAGGLNARQQLAAEREKFTMHTAEVHAWLSLLAQTFGLGSGGVKETCAAVIERAEALRAALDKAKEGLERIAGAWSMNPMAYNLQGRLQHVSDIAAETLTELEAVLEGKA